MQVKMYLKSPWKGLLFYKWFVTFFQSTKTAQKRLGQNMGNKLLFAKNTFKRIVKLILDIHLKS